MSQIHFEKLTAEQLPEVAAIYNHYVLNTTATFHAHRITTDEMKAIVFFDNPKYRTYAVMDGEQLRGYVLLTQHKKREAYDKTAEVTIYLSPDAVGQGFGSLAVQHIEAVAKNSGIHVLVATICGENEQSIRLFERNGFCKCAHYKEVGEKFGQLLDVVAYQKII